MTVCPMSLHRKKVTVPSALRSGRFPWRECTGVASLLRPAVANVSAIWSPRFWGTKAVLGWWAERRSSAICGLGG